MKLHNKHREDRGVKEGGWVKYDIQVVYRCPTCNNRVEEEGLRCEGCTVVYNCITCGGPVEEEGSKCEVCTVVYPCIKCGDLVEEDSRCKACGINEWLCDLRD